MSYRYPSHDQERTRETIRLYEGADRLTCEMEGGIYVVTTDTGERWSIRRNGDCVRQRDGWSVVDGGLEARMEDPEAFMPKPDEDYELASDYELRGTGRRPSDFDSDLATEIALERRRGREDQDYWDRLEVVS